jgi:transcriptional regulator with XRE-family HTH domain
LENNEMSLAEKIKKLRLEKGWNQSYLARETGIPQPTIWRLENGDIEQPKADTLLALASVFKVPVDYLVQDNYELRPSDLIRLNGELRKMVEDYLALPEESKQAVRHLAQNLKPQAPAELKQRFVAKAVRAHRVRKE